MEVTLIWNLLSLVGVGLSVYAAVTATSARTAAKQAAETVVEKKNHREDGDRFRDLLATLNTAKDVAMRRQNEAPASLSVGHDPARDIYTLRTAHDFLATRLPLTLNDNFRADISSAAEELHKAIDNIVDSGSNRDGWKDALSTLQILIPSLEHEDRRQQDRELLEHVTRSK